MPVMKQLTVDGTTYTTVGEVTVTQSLGSGTQVGSIDVDGTSTTLYAPTPTTYTLPTASTSTLGGVKVDGSTITIADGVISAAGGGGGLPAVTSSDNGKVLRVVNGEWAAVSLPSASGVSF